MSNPTGFFDALSQDVRFGVRMWRRSPGFAAVVALVLAVGIGANTAMFTIVDSLLFRRLPGRGSELIGVYSHDRTRLDAYRNFSYPNYVDLRDRRDIFDGLLAHTFAMVGMPAGDTTRRAFVDIVSSNFFSTLGATLAAGRAFTPDEERAGAGIPVVIVRYDYWKRTGFDRDVVGRTLRVNARDFTIVGVAPEGFTGTIALFGPELWMPLGMFDTIVSDDLKNRTGLGDRANGGLQLAGRLTPGLAAADANARLDIVSRGLEDAYREANRNQVVSVHPLSRISMSTTPQSDAPVLLTSAVIMLLPGAVLLIACLNIANMFLARASARRKEIAIRLALGGGRRRIVTQLLTEGLLLALVGAAGGLLLGGWTTRALTASLAGVLPLDLHFSAPLDLNVLLAVTAFAVASTLVFSLAPALAGSRPDLQPALKDEGGNITSRGRLATRSWLVVVQIAISLVLITIGGSVALGALRAARTDPGFRYDGLVLVSTDAAMAGYDERGGRAALDHLLERVRQVPGVTAAAMASLVPFGDSHEGRAVERPGQSHPGGRAPTYTVIGTDYFKTLGLPVLRGREFREIEVSSVDDPLVAIIDERLAARLFPTEDPIGHDVRFTHEGQGDMPGPPMSVVGVVPSVQDELIERVPTAHLYVPTSAAYRAAMSIHVRTAPGREAALADLLRREIQQVDARLPLLELTSMRRFHDRGLLLWVMRASGRLLSAFGILALALAAIGVYGVRSYIVAQRTREFGIRLALGASTTNVMWLVVRDSARLTAIGLILGLPVTFAIAFALARLTNGTLAVAPLALAAAPIVLAIAAAVASWIPARRATRIMPIDALRSQ
jgi:predicted permease